MNIYGNLDGVEESYSPFPKLEIIKDVRFKKAEYVSGTSKQGDAYEKIDIYFERTEGTITQTHVEGILPIKRWENQDDEDYKKSISTWNGKMKHIMSALGCTTEDYTSCTANSFKEFGLNYCQKLNFAPNKDASFYLKTSCNNSGYTSLPKYADFIQLQTPEGSCLLTFNSYEEGLMRKHKNNSKGGIEIEEIDV